MKVLLLILVLYLWRSEGISFRIYVHKCDILISIQGEMCEDQIKPEECTDWNDLQVVKLMHNIKNLSCTIEGKLMVTCTSNINKSQRHSNISIDTVCCTPSETNGEDTKSTDLQNMLIMSSIQTSATDTMTTTQPINKCKCQAAGSAASIGLGAAVGLLVVLLAIVTTGWIWTCWIMKRRGRITTNSRDIR